MLNGGTMAIRSSARQAHGELADSRFARAAVAQIWYNTRERNKMSLRELGLARLRG